MNLLFNEVLNNKICYEDIKNKSQILLLDNDTCFINVIIAFRGRSNFLLPLIENFKKAINYYNNLNYNLGRIVLTFIEHDDQPKHKEILSSRVNYVWTPGNISDQFSRSFAFNFAVKYSNNSTYYLLHDLDLLVKENFFESVLKNLRTFSCLQPYSNRHVLYMTEQLTSRILSGNISIESLDKDFPGVFAPEHKGSKGGSTLISKDLFHKVGGFDPELFWGYAPEDQLFWEKVSAIESIGYADDPKIDVFHMWHEPMINKNPLHWRMEYIMNIYKGMGTSMKNDFINLKRKLYE